MRYGVTGHQALASDVAAYVRLQLDAELAAGAGLIGISSLAGGADQLFARTVLAGGGALEAVVPCAGYRSTFTSDAERASFDQLLDAASQRIVLPFPAPSEEAFLAAGLIVVERSDQLIAIWDGKESRGLGGTGDVVRYARDRHRPVTVIWPAGATRSYRRGP